MTASMYEYVQSTPIIGNDIITPGSISSEDATFCLIIVTALIALIPIFMQ